MPIWNPVSEYQPWLVAMLKADQFLTYLPPVSTPLILSSKIGRLVHVLHYIDSFLPFVGNQSDLVDAGFAVLNFTQMFHAVACMRKENVNRRQCLKTNDLQGGGLYCTVRVSSKQTKKIFGSNRNKPKQVLFRVCFGLFRETKSRKFRFVSVFRTYIETTETNRTVS